MGTYSAQRSDLGAVLDNACATQCIAQLLHQAVLALEQMEARIGQRQILDGLRRPADQNATSKSMDLG